MLTTVLKVQNALASTEPVATEVELIQRLIKQVGKTAENFCNRYFLYAEYTEIFDGDGKDKIYLKGFPIIIITKLEIDDVKIGDSNYEVNKDLGEVYYEPGFTAGYQNIEVTYACGYLAIDEILDKDLSTPPSSSAHGDSYIVKAPGAGAWLNHSNHIARWNEVENAWKFTVPYKNMQVYVVDDGKVNKWSGTAWAVDNSATYSQPSDDLEGAVIDEVVARYTIKQTEPMTVGTTERIVDLRTSFLLKSTRDFFNSLRIINI